MRLAVWLYHTALSQERQYWLLFKSFTADAFVSAVQYGIETFNQPPLKPLMKRAMRADFSDRNMAEGYLDVYQGLIDTLDQAV